MQQSQNNEGQKYSIEEIEDSINNSFKLVQKDFCERTVNMLWELCQNKVNLDITSSCLICMQDFKQEDLNGKKYQQLSQLSCKRKYHPFCLLNFLEMDLQIGGDMNQKLSKQFCGCDMTHQINECLDQNTENMKQQILEQLDNQNFKIRFCEFCLKFYLKSDMIDMECQTKKQKNNLICVPCLGEYIQDKIQNQKFHPQQLICPIQNCKQAISFQIICQFSRKQDLWNILDFRAQINQQTYDDFEQNVYVRCQGGYLTYVGEIDQNICQDNNDLAQKVKNYSDQMGIISHLHQQIRVIKQMKKIPLTKNQIEQIKDKKDKELIFQKYILQLDQQNYNEELKLQENGKVLLQIKTSYQFQQCQQIHKISVEEYQQFKQIKCDCCDFVFCSHGCDIPHEKKTCDEFALEYSEIHKENKRKITQNRIEVKLINNQITCPNPNCRLIGVKEGDCANITCPRCLTNFCAICQKYKGNQVVQNVRKEEAILCQCKTIYGQGCFSCKSIYKLEQTLSLKDVNRKIKFLNKILEEEQSQIDQNIQAQLKNFIKLKGTLKSMYTMYLSKSQVNSQEGQDFEEDQIKFEEDSQNLIRFWQLFQNMNNLVLNCMNCVGIFCYFCGKEYQEGGIQEGGIYDGTKYCDGSHKQFLESLNDYKG